MAIHRAVEAIRRGECERAIAGGVNVILSPALQVAFSKSGMLSPDGRCKTFDQSADGYVRGEGAGAILLKSLKKALDDRDPIHAVIRATAINHGGHASSLAAPNPKAQSDLIVHAFCRAGIDPATVTYIETHGTGTALGDPIEINGLKMAFRALFERGAKAWPDKPYCGLGAVKTNIGHLEPAAGIAGVLKVLLAMKHRTIPANLHLKKPNAYIDLKGTPFYLVSEKRPWQALVDNEGRKIPRRAGVSSFGFGGVNAHIVLEEPPLAPVAEPLEAQNQGQLFVLSAKSRQQLKVYTRRMAAHLNKEVHRGDSLSLRDIAFTVQVGRPALEERLAVVAGSIADLIGALNAFAGDGVLPDGLFHGRAQKSASAFAQAQSSPEWMRQQSLDRLAQVWVAGAVMDWRRLHGSSQPRRICLPTYPFERRRYWATDHSHAADDATIAAQPAAVGVANTQPATAALAKDLSGSVLKLMGRSEEYLVQVVADVTRLPIHEINPLQPFEAFGIDSLTTIKLTYELEKQFGKLSKTLFFEYRNIRELAAFLVARYPDALEAFFGMEPGTVETSGPAETGAPPPVLPAQSEAGPGRQTAVNPADQDDIAIIGLSGRYPGADTLDQFWENLCAGKDCITEIPGDRWKLDNFYDPEPGKPGRSYSRWGGFIDGVDRFDPLFFNISPKEAEFMDPQERLFLQIAWWAMEDAGYTRRALAQWKVGVYVGVMYGQYQLWQAEMDGGCVSPGSFHAAVANRVSYHLNLNGPSVALDTMCSSSLTAIHLACESLRRGESQIALAGGVNLSIHPNKYTFLSLGRFISTDGRCRSFGEGGDGYVPGEGVGAVVLKPLAQALTDRDHIYALIKGSALNHGGKTSSFSVPNPNAQGELIGEALQNAAVHPRTLSYLEAHGTGTSLGDPIEISGLIQCFSRYTRDKQFCPIGSVKSNIGHLEAAAGIAALTKVLLQLKHTALVPSIHSSCLNPNIDFSESPFFVQRELAPWPRPNEIRNDISRELPRRAGISSFGAGGANAHVIVEEFQYAASVPDVEPTVPQLVVLSAPQPAVLDQMVDRLLALLNTRDTGEQPAIRLQDLAFTLQVGREAFKERLAVIAERMSELVERLEKYRRGAANLSGVFRSAAQANPMALDSILDNSQGREFIRSLASGGNLTALARLWVTGLEIDWTQIKAHTQSRRISLPTYPFARERYWLPRSSTVGLAAASTLHPLVQRNISTFHRQSYETLLAPDAVWITDHRVAGKKMLPGTAVLEMARAAGWMAEERNVGSIRTVRWRKTIVTNGSVLKIRILLEPTESGAWFEIHAGPQDDNSEPHACGEIVFTGQEGQPSGEQRSNIETILRRCDSTLKGTACYEMFRATGIDYGPSFQSIQALSFNEKEVLAHLCLPERWGRVDHEWVLHPALLDGAFQAVLGLLMPSHGEPGTIFVPAGLENLEIYGPLPSACYAHITSDQAVGERVDKLVINLSVLDEAGRLVARAEQLTFRTLSPSAVPRTHFYEAVWEDHAQAGNHLNDLNGKVLMVFDNEADYARSITEVLSRQSVSPGRIVRILPGEVYQEKNDDTWVVNPNSEEDFRHLVEAQKASPHAVLFLWTLDQEGIRDQSTEARLSTGYYSMLFCARALLRHKGTAAVRMLFVYCQDTPSGVPEFAAIGGLTKTIRAEDPRFICKTLDLEQHLPRPLQTAEICLLELSQCHDAVEVRYRGEQRQVKGLRPLGYASGDNGAPLIKHGGVYAITGGAGGLGLIIAEYLAQNYNACLILAGRSVPDDRLVGKLAALEALGAQVQYIKADVSRVEDAHHIVRQAKDCFGKLNGVIHAAGLIRDSLIVNKKPEDVKAVLAPKIAGTMNLDEATRDEPLDFFVLFSSLSSVTGNVGQCDYAFANAFLDAFAQGRERLRRSGQRSGTSLSINWPLWDSGRMQISEQARSLMENKLGLVPLPSQQGLKAFETGLRAERTQLIVFHGDVQKTVMALNERALSSQRRLSAGPQSPGAEAGNGAPVAEIESYLISEFSHESKLARERITATEPMEHYGIDSIMIMNMLGRMETVFGELPKTLFYEFQTIRDLAVYLAENHPVEFAAPRMHSTKSARPEFCAPSSRNKAAAPVLVDRAHRFASVFRMQPGRSGQATRDIAIIGLAGRYPQAEDLRNLWDNLKDGRDCICEVPAERWEHTRYFDPDKARVGKTYSKWGGFLSDIDKFDALFFNISPREAALIDPQERLFLEIAWAVIEDAGYTCNRLAQSLTGVFAGAMWSQYQLMTQQTGDVMTTPSSSFASIANRVSYYLNLHGPSMTVDTMCSSSLTAIHLAVDSLRKGECQIAIAGGVNVTAHPAKYVLLSQSGFLSSDGRCRSFGSGGDGYVPGEGVGAVLLKPLAQALKDRDYIYAVIKEAAVNHGGKTNGYTVPSPAAQSLLIRGALKAADMDPRTVTYIEAHGTGTALGDPIEIAGLTQAFATHGPTQPWCAVGSNPISGIWKPLPESPA